ncbi:hypothetical protein N0V94_007209 [Neodidymelliopsis sp. IMI 364377]|nr:hypothetical protein N0V94_007209 [Neodidymelliopsis sp. IMI 364377]
MTSSTYKGNLAVGGSALDKSKLQLRRPTPDSDALASSDDDRDHVPVVVRPTAGYPGGRRPSSGWLQDIQPNRKFSLPSVSFAGSQPTTPSIELPNQTRPVTSAFPWNTSSFSNAQSNSRLKEVVPSPTSAQFPGERSLPSPAALEGDEGIGFLLNQQNPIRKAVRSQSYSIGQGDIENSPVGQFSARVRTTAGVRHRPSKPSLLGDSGVGLSQLREDDIDEVDSSNGSEHGIRLPQGYWEREQKQALLKQAAVENARARNRATSTSSPVHQHPMPPQRRKTTAGLRNMSYGGTADYAIEEHEDHENAAHALPPSSLTRRFSEHVSILSREPEQEIVDSPKKQQWATGNIHNLGMDAMGRRHSFAHYGGFNQSMPISTLSNTQEEDENVVSPRQASHSPEEQDQFDAAAYFAGYGPASRAINASAISAAHPDPVVPNSTLNTTNPYAVPPVLGRPGRRLFVVTFKCSRADIYYLYDNTGLEIRRGDLVIVEGDRGCDLGQVAHADVSLEDAKKYKAEANEEHFRWLVMFSQYSLAGTQNDSGMLGALARANGLSNNPNQPQLSGMIGNQDQDAKPKMIKRLAQQHEIFALRDKEGSEAKAKRLGAQKAADHKLPMEVLDAEYQADYHKLTYFYYAESYVNFNDLVTDLFKQYKVRIWMSAVNPASVVNPSGMMQIPPPSAIGPGAIMNSGTGNSSLPVGPGFGNNHRPNEHYGRGRNNTSQTNYDEGNYAFSHQLPAYGPQAAYGMPPWAQGQQYQQQIYGAYGAYAAGYPNASASGSPMNFGAYYPPASTYGVQTAYNRGYPGSNSYTSTGGANFGQQATSGASNGKPGSGFGTQSGTSASNGNDQAFLTGMQNMSLSSK